MVKRKLGFEGYFDLYNIPSSTSRTTISQRRRALCSEGLNRGENIFDFLNAEKIPYFVSNLT